MIVDTIIGEIVSKVFNDIVDISKKEIINAVKNKNNKHQSLDSQLYNITVDVLNDIFSNSYEKNQDKIFDVTEALLKGYEDKKNDTEIIRLCSEVYELYNNDRHIEFKKLLYHKLSKEKYKELNNEIDLLWKEQEGKKTSKIVQELNRTNQTLNNIGKSNKFEVINFLRPSHETASKFGLRVV